MLTLRGLPKVTSADAIARPAMKKENASTSIISAHEQSILSYMMDGQKVSLQCECMHAHV
jgi:hypothetical protein